MKFSWWLCYINTNRPLAFIKTLRRKSQTIFMSVSFSVLRISLLHMQLTYICTLYRVTCLCYLFAQIDIRHVWEVYKYITLHGLYAAETNGLSRRSERMLAPTTWESILIGKVSFESHVLKTGVLNWDLGRYLCFPSNLHVFFSHVSKTKQPFIQQSPTPVLPQ